MENAAAADAVGVVEAVASGKRRAAPARYLHPLAHYASILKRQDRQLKRWIAQGRSIVPPELPPFDDLPKLAAWFSKAYNTCAPDDLVALAEASSPLRSNPIDVSLLEATYVQVVEDARRFVKASAQQLSEAFASGQETLIDRAQRRFERAADGLRKLEAGERAAAKQRGDLISVADLLPEMSALLGTLRVMRSTMGRRIRARLTLPPELDAKLDAVIEDERRGEEAVLRRLSQFRSVDEIEAALTSHGASAD